MYSSIVKVRVFDTTNLPEMEGIVKSKKTPRERRKNPGGNDPAENIS